MVIALALALFLSGIANAQPWKKGTRNYGKKKTVVLPPAFGFARSDGAGLASYGSICASQASAVSANGLCFDGVTGTASPTAVTASSTPTAVTRGECGNGPNCGNTTWRVFDGVDDDYRSAAVTQPAGDFYAAIVATRYDDTTEQNIFAKESSATAGRSFYLKLSAGSGTVRFGVYKAGGVLTQVSSSASTVAVVGARQLYEIYYDYVADGTSIMRLWVDGVLVASSTAAVGPPTATSTPISIASANTRGSYLRGAVSEALFTETLPSDATRELIARAALGASYKAFDKDERQLTISRAERTYCEGVDTSVVTPIPAARPCIRNGGVNIAGNTVNTLPYSEALDTSAAWIPWSQGSTLNPGAPTVTANTTEVTDPLGGNTAEKIVFPAVTVATHGSNASSMVYAANTGNVSHVASTRYTQSVWVRSDGASAGQTVRLFFYHPGSNTYHSTACGSTTTWQRCILGPNTITGGTPTLALARDMRDPAQASGFSAAGTFYVWGFQEHSSDVPGRYCPTAATAGVTCVGEFSAAFPTASTTGLSQTVGKLCFDYTPAFTGTPIDVRNLVSFGSPVTTYSHFALSNQVSGYAGGTGSSGAVNTNATLTRGTKKRFCMTWNAGAGNYRMENITNGTTSGNVGFTTLPAFSAVSLGAMGNVGYNPQGDIGNVCIESPTSGPCS